MKYKQPQLKSAEEYFARALSHDNIGQKVMALEDYTKAIQFKPYYA